MKTNTTEQTIQLPASVLVKNQKKQFGPVIYPDGNQTLKITATVRHDDQCGNGHNSFSITAEIRRKGWRGTWQDDSFGCCHDEVAKRFPELAPFIKWHLTSTDGPLHYIENAKYWAGHSGWRDGKPNDPPNLEHLKSTICYGALSDDLEFDLADHIYSDARGFTWNESQRDELTDWLIKRSTRLLLEFKRDVESLGFVY